MWQPIETAPKDGGWIIVAVADSEVKRYWPRQVFWKNGEWVVDSTRHIIALDITPTHWMPLPEPPESN